MNTSHDETPADNQGALTRAQIGGRQYRIAWNAALDAVLAQPRFGGFATS